MTKYYLVEMCGPERQMWGPYLSFRHAKAEAGKRHLIVTGEGCSNGRKVRPAELRDLIRLGAIVPSEPVAVDSL